MVTVVTVTVFLSDIRLYKWQHKGEKSRIKSSFAYTQTIVRLYANDRSPIPDFKRYISV